MGKVKPQRYRPNEEDDEGESFLAYWRKKRGLDQQSMADAVGVSLRTYRRLERGDVDDPGVRLLHNCAIVLGCSLYDIIPSQWCHWTVFDDERAVPPRWEDIYDFDRDGSDASLPLALQPEVSEQFDGRWLEARRSALARKWRKLRSASFA